MTKKIKQRYESHGHKVTPALPGVTSIYRPWINVRLEANGKLTRFFKALIDSGSDYTLFPTKAGEAIDIDIEAGPSHIIYGVGGGEIKARFHDVTLYVSGYEVIIRAGFTDEVPFGGLGILGTIGFFDNFKVGFNGRKGKFEIEPYD